MSETPDFLYFEKNVHGCRADRLVHLQRVSSIEVDGTWLIFRYGREESAIIYYGSDLEAKQAFAKVKQYVNYRSI